AARGKKTGKKKGKKTMTAITDQAADAPVRKTITVRVSQQRAFDVFFAEFDTWWPRTHHIGSSPMKRAIVEGRAGLHRAGRRHRVRLGHCPRLGAAAPRGVGLADRREMEIRAGPRKVERGRGAFHRPRRRLDARRPWSTGTCRGMETMRARSGRRSIHRTD